MHECGKADFGQIPLATPSILGQPFSEYLNLHFYPFMLTSESLVSILPIPTGRVFIAYSGGIDSHVLLHLASRLNVKSKITAVYVHHGLQKEADSWEQHCQAVALALSVDFLCLKVNAQKVTGQSPEEVARDARYQVLKPLLKTNDVLLLGQHREDQMESVLLQLFRGAGVQGLSGMPLSSVFGCGLMCRPFLDIAKQVIRDYACHYDLHWIEDPSNLCDDFDRNYLRNKILPLIKQRWPAIDKTVARSARHCANSQNLIEKIANELFVQFYDESDNTLNGRLLIDLDINHQSLVIRQWFRVMQLRMPSEKKLQRIINEVISAKASAKPQIQGTGYCIRRYRDKLYCLRVTGDDIVLQEKQWPAGQNQLITSDGQRLSLIKTESGVLKKLWIDSQVTIRYRKGGEKIRLPGREGRHALKKLYQEKAIPPWERNTIPLIYLDDRLAVVVGLWISADFLSTNRGECYQVGYLDKE